MKKPKKQKAESDKVVKSNITPRQRAEAVRSYMRFTRGDDYDFDPLRRYVREHGGHCSGGGGAC